MRLPRKSRRSSNCIAVLVSATPSAASTTSSACSARPFVIAGEAGVADYLLEAHMWLDLAGFARPVTKYAARAVHPGSVLRLLRRYFKVAATPPFGPTFLCVPQGYP